MPYTIYNADGSVASSGGAASSGAAASTKGTPIKMGNFWSNGTMPNSATPQYGPFIEVLQKWNNSPIAAIDSSWTATAAGYVNALTLYANGSTSGSDCTAYMVKNGNVSTLSVVANIASGGAGKSFQGQGGSSFSFVKGDFFKVFINSANTSVDQSFSAGLEVVYT